MTGQTNAVTLLASIFGIKYVAVSSGGAAQKNNVQIMLVLDRSGSMSGTPIADLKNAAAAFIAYYQGTQDVDEIGLVSFATGVTVNYPLNTYFYTPILNALNAMNATGATNTEDALAQAGLTLPTKPRFPLPIAFSNISSSSPMGTRPRSGVHSSATEQITMQSCAARAIATAAATACIHRWDTPIMRISTTPAH